ncbi:hypothetical protein GOP47_0030183 [Adiantum capillus-veneris]|nr:hypothetical protein GOP47_0030183 [Adiantum capillus-veneris]
MKRGLSSSSGALKLFVGSPSPFSCPHPDNCCDQHPAAGLVPNCTGPIFPPLRSTALNWGTCWRMWFLPTKLLRVAHQLPCSASSYAAALSLVSIDVVICIDVAERAGSKVADRHSLRVRAGLRLLWRLQTSICFGAIKQVQLCGMLVFFSATGYLQ